MSSHSKLLLLMLTAVSALAAQASPYIIDDAMHTHDTSSFPLDLVIDAQDAIYAVGRDTLDTMVVTRYDAALDSVASWRSPVLTGAPRQDGDLCAVASGCVFLGSGYSAADSLSPWLVRLDANCDTLWTRLYDDWGQARGVFAAAGDDELYIIVRDLSEDNYFLARCDADGAVLWSEPLDEFAALTPTGMATLGDSLAVVVCQGDNDGNQYALLKAFTSEGEWAWSILADSYQDDYSRCVIPLSDGGFAWCITQYSYQYQHFTGSVYRYDAQLELVWDRISTLPSQTTARTGTEGPDGAVYVGGSLSTGEDLDAWLWRIGPDGASDWTITYPFDEFEKIYSLVCTQDNLPVFAVLNRNDTHGYEGLLATVAPFNVNFDTDNTYGPLPLETEFTATATGPIDEWYWDFDSDGAIDASGPNVSWTYEESAIYDVTLMVEGDGRFNSYTREQCVTVTVSVGEDDSDLQTPAILFSSYESGAWVSLAIPSPTQARVEMYNIRGQLVGKLVDGPMQTGVYPVRPPVGTASGVYLLRLTSGGVSKLYKTVLLK